MGRALRGLLGAVLAIGLCEGGLRLYFHEHEADRVYWGRDAFVLEAGLPYRHVGHVSLPVGREGSFQQMVHTNSLGFRDQREPPAEPGDHRMLVVGASLAFGLGVLDADDLLHVRLEAELRKRPDWPDDLEIYNVSQSGYNIASVAELLRRNLGRYTPEAIFLTVPPSAFKPQNALGSKIVHGYRMNPERFAAGTPLDWLRARSYLVMRALNPFDGGLQFHRERILGPTPRTAADLETTRELIGVLSELRDDLSRDGITLFCIPVAGAVEASVALRRLGFRVISVPPPPEWILSGDFHMNGRGHRELAAIIARTLPAHERVKRLNR